MSRLLKRVMKSLNVWSHMVSIAQLGVSTSPPPPATTAPYSPESSYSDSSSSPPQPDGSPCALPATGTWMAPDQDWWI